MTSGKVVVRIVIDGVVGHLLGTMRAADLAIEDPPLEDILRVMFGKAKDARA